ncbi:glycosyl transferase [Bacteroidia bacterium]|nr:glycosyl transferase [Bacteroidia bacterium]
MKNNSNNPLVSIVVITYNSSKYVLETLESAKAQTYQNIELIVTDDCSTDNTVEICKQWIEENEERFVRTELITVEKNTGIPANCNRGVKSASGEWLKLIAGDDTFLGDCISNFVNYVTENKSAKVICAIANQYKDSFSKENFIKQSGYSSLFYDKRITAKQQFELLLRDSIVSAPTVFLNKRVVEDMGFFNEKYILEDTYLWLKLTKNGIKIDFMDKPVVNYRKHSYSISNNYGVYFFKYYSQLTVFYDDCVFPYLSKNYRKEWIFNYYKNAMYYRLKIKNPLIKRIIGRLNPYLYLCEQDRKKCRKEIDKSFENKIIDK